MSDMDDDFMVEDDEDFEFDYEDEEDGNAEDGGEVDLENRYYNAKGAYCIYAYR